MESNYIKPAEIESRSMEIIMEELGERAGRFSIDELAVVRRVIHTSADFDYADNLFFSTGIMEILKAQIRNGCRIVTDTRMAFSGINKRELEKYGVEVVCYMDDPAVAKEATERGVTRATVSMEKACADGKNTIFVVGNAPTALMALCSLKQHFGEKIKAVIAMPVGFVNVVEAKEEIIENGFPCIVARGRKGGSNVAASVVNAVTYSMR